MQEPKEQHKLIDPIIDTIEVFNHEDFMDGKSNEYDQAFIALKLNGYSICKITYVDEDTRLQGERLQGKPTG